MSRRRALQVCAAMAAAIFLALLTRAAPALAEDELRAGRFALCAPDGRVLLRTGIVVAEGDWLLTADGAVHRIAAVEGARATLVPSSLAEITYRSPVSWFVWPAAHIPPPETMFAGKRVIIYSTHDDETFRGAVPVTGAPDGTAVHVLAAADPFVAEAATWGLQVSIDTTSHWPHDGDAYRRSARTVRELLRRRPDYLLDWQTDRPPAPGEPIEAPACLLVVGGSTPRLKANLNFARALMTAANRAQPGTVKGILVGRGDYAQLYYPASTVVIAGTAADDPKAIGALAISLADALGGLHKSAQYGGRGLTPLGAAAVGLGIVFQWVTFGRRREGRR